MSKQLTTALQPIVRALAGKNKNTANRGPSNSGKRRGGSKRQRRGNGNQPRRQQTAALPAAYASHVRPRFRLASRTQNSAVVSGCDLIYPIPIELQPDSDTIFCVFPANPAYWSGTKIAQFAPAYQTYRPLRFQVSYIPQVAVTQQGTVFMGTLWNEAAPTTNIQQSLFTSNGGCLTQCYVPCDTTVNLGRNLPQNLFNLNDSLHPDTCPFLFMAGVRGSSVVPGYFYVTYTYEFRNPIGSAWVFNRSDPTNSDNISELPRYENMTFVITQGSGAYGPGTQFDYEPGLGLMYHGTPVTLTSVNGVMFSNSQSAVQTYNLLSRTSLTRAQVTGSDVGTRNTMQLQPGDTPTINVTTERLLYLQITSDTAEFGQAIPVSGVVSLEELYEDGGPKLLLYWLCGASDNTIQLLSADGELFQSYNPTLAAGDVNKRVHIPSLYSVQLN